MPEIESKINESKIVLANRKDLCINGVTEFVSATETSVILILDKEQFVVEGKNLTVTNLDTTRKVLELKGDVDALYFTKKQKGSKFSIKNIFNR